MVCFAKQRKSPGSLEVNYWKSEHQMRCYPGLESALPLLLLHLFLLKLPEMMMMCLWPCTHSDHSYLQGDVFKSSALTMQPKHLHGFEDFSSMPSLFCLWQTEGFPGTEPTLR